jgi:hypothetical protein
MGKKKAMITVELVDESAWEADEKIAQELLDWFTEDAGFIPWVKNVKDVVLNRE